MNTNKDTAFLSQEFQNLLARKGIAHRKKEALNDIATIDAAIREIRRALGRRTAQPGSGNWADELDAAIAGHNRSSHSAILGSDPNDVKDNKQLRFALRYENAEKMHEHVELMNKRQENWRRQVLTRPF